MDNRLEQYGDLFTKLGLTELSVKDGNFEVVMKKEAPVVNMTGAAVTPVVGAAGVGYAQPVADANGVIPSSAAINGAGMPVIGGQAATVAAAAAATSDAQGENTALAQRTPGSLAVIADESAIIRSPLTGIFYSSESPTSSSFVKEGDTVKKGDLVCVIETMKMFNDVVATQDGVIKKICKEDGQLVEYDEPLFYLA